MENGCGFDSRKFKGFEHLFARMTDQFYQNETTRAAVRISTMTE